MNIRNLQELRERGTLGCRDYVHFYTEEGVLIYFVSPYVLHNIASYSSDDEIFSVLNIDKAKLCSDAYGYYKYPHAKKGSWPMCQKGDYEALTRAVDKLYSIIEAKTKAKAMEVSRFELIDLD